MKLPTDSYTQQNYPLNLKEKWKLPIIKDRLKEDTTTKAYIQRILKGIFQTKKKGKCNQEAVGNNYTVKWYLRKGYLRKQQNRT